VFLPLMDVGVSVASIYVALLIRFAFEGGPVPDRFLQPFLSSLVYVIPVRLLTFHGLGLYRQMWSRAGVLDLLRVVAAVTLDALLSTTILFLVARGAFPRSVPMIAWLLTLAGLLSVRLVMRMDREWEALRARRNHAGRLTLIFGAGAAGTMLSREFAGHPELESRVIGFLDDDPRKHGLQVDGIPVIGGRSDLTTVGVRFGATDLVIAMPSAGQVGIREVARLGINAGLRVRTVPGLYELVTGQAPVSRLREVQLEDLLEREEVKLDLEILASFLANQVVLVTGAGGSIGAELCRQLIRFGPASLVLLGHGENSIYDIERELRRTHSGVSLHPVIADVRHPDRIDQVMRSFKPSIVFHAAAYKHLPLMETNPEEAVTNNVFGTLTMAEAAQRHGVDRFVLISTDKAVSPTSIMGATKRLAEQVVRRCAGAGATRFVAVRFGNVLGSRGSVVPLFQEQISAGGPITITDRRMTRYFMTIPEAAQLVIQAAAMGAGGEVFVLDMGKATRILDLAYDLIRLSGLEPEVDIEIVEVGARPGEKLTEELLSREEGALATRHDRIFVAQTEATDAAQLAQTLGALKAMLSSGHWDEQELRSLLLCESTATDTGGTIASGGVERP